MASLSDQPTADWRQVARSYFHTTLFCIAIGTTLWLLGLATPWWGSLFISLCIGYSINTASVLVHPLMTRFLPPLIASLSTTLIGVSTGILLGGYLAVGDATFFFRDDDYSTPILGLFFGVLGFLFFNTQQQLKEAGQKLTNATATQLVREKAHLETQLRLLQAQIEPHFLFNTLSNIVGMIKDQPDAAEDTLLQLTKLLRANLKRTRETSTILGDELEIIEALLKISQIRMGSRLDYLIDVEDSLLALPLPPMLLQPLVENAIKHGIEPMEGGGTIRIAIRHEDGQLRVEISDTGMGLGATSQPTTSDLSGADTGTGTGIANVQSRLSTLFGDDARLTLQQREPSGMIATMTFPAASS